MAAGITNEIWTVKSSLNFVENKKEYIERLQLTIHHLHGVDSRHLESVSVHEVFRGQTVWRGVVEVFGLVGHPEGQSLLCLEPFNWPK